MFVLRVGVLLGSIRVVLSPLGIDVFANLGDVLVPCALQVVPPEKKDNDAAFAVEFAYAAIEEAEYAVLDAALAGPWRICLELAGEPRSS